MKGPRIKVIIAIGLFWLGIAASASAQTFTITAIGNAFYVINGADNPTLTLQIGTTYTFDIDAPGHPFFINTVEGLGSANEFTTGVTNYGASDGTITFDVPDTAPATLFYDDEFHAAMKGTINIVPAPEPFPMALLFVGLTIVAWKCASRRRRPATGHFLDDLATQSAIGHAA